MAATTGSASTSPFIPIPKVVHDFFAHFPLHTYPPILAQSPRRITRPTLWIVPPKSDIILPSTNLLSQDVGCLKWQAYIALRGLKDVGVRWDVSAEGAVDGTLPSLQLPAEGTRGEVLGAKEIPKWAAGMLGDEKEKGVFEGYRDDKAKEESRAWVSLLEGAVHAALVNACLLASSFYLKLITSLRSSTNPIPRSFHHSFLHRCLT